MIPTEAVEAAARELYARDGYSPWELEEDSVREKYLRKVAHILEAAAPHMLAVAWDEGWEACVTFSTYPEIDGETPTSDNPYRPAQ